MPKWINTLVLAAALGCGVKLHAEGGCQAVLCPPVGLTPDECKNMPCKMLECPKCVQAETCPPCQQGPVPVCLTSSSGTTGCCGTASPCKSAPCPISSSPDVECGKTCGGVCPSSCTCSTGCGTEVRPAKPKNLLDCLRKLFAREKWSPVRTVSSTTCCGGCDVCAKPQEKVIILESKDGVITTPQVPSMAPANHLPPANPLPAAPLPMNPAPANPLPMNPAPARTLPTNPAPANPLPMNPAPASTQPGTMLPADTRTRMETTIPGSYPSIQRVPGLPTSYTK